MRQPEGGANAKEAGPDRAGTVGGAETGQPRTLNVGLILLGLLAAIIVAGLWMSRETWRSMLPEPEMQPDTLALVNGEPVTVADVDFEVAVQLAIQAELGRVLPDDEAVMRAYRHDILEDLVDQQLLLEGAAGAGIEVSDADLDAEWPRMGEQYDITMDALRDRLAGQGVGADELREWARRSLVVAAYLKTDEAREAGLAVYREKGRSESELAEQEVKPADVASTLQQDARIRFNFGEDQRFTAAHDGDPAPDLALSDLNGHTVRLADFRGHPVMINFWATWCKPCKEEIPLYAEAFERYKHQGLVILAIDAQEPLDVVRQYVDEHDVPFTVLLDSDGQVATIYRVRGWPTTAFVNADGVLVKTRRGQVKSAEDLETLLRLILPEAE